MQILSRVSACAEIRDMHLRRDGVLLVERTDRDFWVRKPEESTTWVTPYKKLLTPSPKQLLCVYRRFSISVCKSLLQLSYKAGEGLAGGSRVLYMQQFVMSRGLERPSRRYLFEWNSHYFWDHIRRIYGGGGIHCFTCVVSGELLLCTQGDS